MAPPTMSNQQEALPYTSVFSKISIAKSAVEPFLDDFVSALLAQATEVAKANLCSDKKASLSGEDADESSLASVLSDSTKESIVVPLTSSRSPGSLSPSKRTRKMMKEETAKSDTNSRPPYSTPSSDRLTMSSSESTSENSCSLTPLFQNLIRFQSPEHHQTPIGKVDFTNPDQRFLWDKENWDAQKKCFSNDRKKKRAKKVVDGKNGSTRLPLQDITGKKVTEKVFGQERQANTQNTLHPTAGSRPLFVRRAAVFKKKTSTEEIEPLPKGKAQNNSRPGASSTTRPNPSLLSMR